MCQTSVAESADFGMNTEIMHKVFGENSQEALISSKAELARLENRLSRFISGSEGPLIDLWDYKNASEAPKEERIQHVLPLVNYCEFWWIMVRGYTSQRD